MMEAVRTSETSVDNNFTRQYIPEDNSEREYFTLYKELVEDSIRFRQYFRMSESMYLNLLSLIEDLMKKNTTFREATSPR
jgi:hypothetical protein